VKLVLDRVVVMCPTTLIACAAVALLLSVAGCEREARARQEQASSPETAQRVRALVGKTLQQMAFVPGGGFWLGDFGILMNDNAKKNDIPPGPDAKPEENNLPFTAAVDNKPPKWVTFDGFHIQKYKVTYEDFDVYVAANALPAHPPQGDEIFQLIWQDARRHGDNPAGVTWYQAKAYCQWLGKVSRLPFDLPTEAQWEYAASNRTNSYHHPFPTQTGLLKERVTHPSFRQKEELTGPRADVYPVGRFEPNRLGLYDLLGDGFDWVNDWYSERTYQSEPTHNPKGPVDGTEKVLRGKSSFDDWVSAFPHITRYHQRPDKKVDAAGKQFALDEEGFRCVVNQPTPLAAR